MSPHASGANLVGGVWLHELRDQLGRIARSELSVVVHGESGTGKEPVARELHELSGRSGRFVAVNCTALPATLIESELFGYKRGAFSGATMDKPGLVRAADGGTLFLDEIGECSAAAINPLDRSVLGHYSEAAHTIADLTVIGMLTLPLLLNAIDSRGAGWLTDTVVFGEALLIAQALTQLTKFAVRRTAPFVYDPAAPEDAVKGKDAARSFISGHTTMAFAAAAAYTVTYWKRHPDSDARWVVLGTGVALSIGVALLKIFAGYHFVTDVLAGALVGAGVGVLVPLLHVRD